MQTFLPYADFAESARVLDWRRLGKQRSETKQLIMALTVEGYGWANHPAAKMWAGHVGSLAAYGVAICSEWRGRGYQDTLLPFFEHVLFNNFAHKPKWVGDHDFHQSHRSNLLRKAPEHYRQYWPDTPDNLPYIWPTP